MRRTLQALLAWFEEGEAVAALLDHHIPGRTEDTSAMRALFEEKRRALMERPVFVEGDPGIEVLPLDLQSGRRDAVQSLLGSERRIERADNRAVLIDLRNVLCFQKTVAIDRPDDRIDGLDPGDMRAIFDVCLPGTEREEQLDGALDQDGRAMTITSENPNLRLGPMQTVEHPPGSGVHMVGFPVVYGTSYMQVVEYKGRYILKNGYHRAFSFLARGIHRVPVVLQTGRSFSDIYRNVGSQISAEQLLGGRPPTLMDFHDASVSATVHQRAFRKAVRIQAEEFIVNL